MRKRTAARSFLIPLGGRTTYVVGLGALMSTSSAPLPPLRLRERLRHDATEGAWHDGPRRYLMLRPDSLMGALRHLDATIRDAVFDALAQSLQRHGGDSLRAYAAQVPGDAQALIAATVDAAADLGWGRWEIVQHGAVLELTVHASPFAAGWLATQAPPVVADAQPPGLAASEPAPALASAPSAPALASAPTAPKRSANEPAPTVCAPIRGMFAALAQTLGDPAQPVQVQELCCAAQGHADCRFRAAPARTAGAS